MVPFTALRKKYQNENESIRFCLENIQFNITFFRDCLKLKNSPNVLFYFGKKIAMFDIKRKTQNFCDQLLFSNFAQNCFSYMLYFYINWCPLPDLMPTFQEPNLLCDVLKLPLMYSCNKVCQTVHEIEKYSFMFSSQPTNPPSIQVAILSNQQYERNRWKHT